MRYALLCHALVAAQLVCTASAANPPTGVVTRAGDQSIVLHWDRTPDATVMGYRVYKADASDGPFTLVSSVLATSPGYCDLSVSNGATNFYQVTAVLPNATESVPSVTVSAAAHAFSSDDEFLEYIQQVHFDYFWYLGNPANGLVPDRSATGSACSIAAVGFGLSALTVGIDHGWITRAQGAARVGTTLNTFLTQPQGPESSGKIGYKGWFYHFLNMNTAVRASAELSSIDSALFLAGALSARQYFDGPGSDEAAIRNMADAIYARVDWNWMARGSNALAMGWFPDSGFIANNWVGYNEGMILYLLGLGAPTNALPNGSWAAWTNGYTWFNYNGLNYVPFAPLFAHQYSQSWVDFRHVADAFMATHASTYFENSKRATLAQIQYCIANPKHEVGYSSNVWGLTACDTPAGYGARGAPGPGTQDDGTIAPTAAGGSMPFTPEYSLPTLRYFYSHYRPRIWTAYGFRDAFNLGAQWWDADELGIDQGPIVLMIENYRTQRLWQRFMRAPEIQRGLQRAGFTSLPSVEPSLETDAAKNAVVVSWDSAPGRTYQTEYSEDLDRWYQPPGGELEASGPTASWTDLGPPATPAAPAESPQRFYRVFEFGTP